MTEVCAGGVQIGQILAQKYRVEQVLGVGGMGVVVAAHHLELDERVAIKLLLSEMLEQPGAVARFTREARAAVKIKSEHVARVLDVGVLDDGAPFIVMEYLQGADLAAWLRNSGPLSIEQGVEFLLQAGEAIAEAHTLGIVHRDLKPANLFAVRRPDGQLSIKVLDFGISKVSDPAMAAGATTKTLAVLGSPLYMSPEQMESARTADSRSDIWALGVILYELLTGECPFNGETLPEIVLRVATSRPVPLRSKQPNAPEGLDAVVMRCLEKDPERRFQTVAELAIALAEFAPKRALISVERISGTFAAAGLLPPLVAEDSLLRQGGVTETTSSFGATAARKRPRKVAMRVGALALLAATVVVGGAVALGGRFLGYPAVAGAASMSAAAAQLPGSAPAPVVASRALVSAPSVDALAPGVASLPVQPLLINTAAEPPRPRTVQPARSARRVPAKVPSANCTPNFYLDAQGEKHFKPECF